MAVPASHEVVAAGVVLAAGASRRLGRPKQLLPYRGATLLDAALDTLRASPLNQRIVTLGASAAAIRSAVDLRGVEVVDVPSRGSGCAASIAAALGAVDARADGIVLLLGDQPGVTVASVGAVLDAARHGAELAVCRYADGRGHPLWLGRPVFGELRDLHGDRGVWRLLERHGPAVVEVGVAGPVPPDVDTAAAYERLLAQESARG